MNYKDRAIKDRYLVIDKKKDTITYLPQGKTRRYSNPEEQVQMETFLELIYGYNYPAERVKVSERVIIGSSSREADVVVFKDDKGKDPYIVVECKKRNVSESVFEDAISQGFSYAAVTNAEYVWTTSGDRNAYHEVWHDKIKEREKNVIDRLPKFKEEKQFGYQFRKRFRVLLEHPIFSDTLMYMTILLISTVLLSKMAVEFNNDIYQLTEPLWLKNGMDFNWVYNGILALATTLSLLFGMVFMRSHKLFKYSEYQKRLSYFMISLVIFLPSWYIGVDMADPQYWSWTKYRDRGMPIMTYLWPYIKAIPFQFIAIYGLIWLVRLGIKRAAEDESKK